VGEALGCGGLVEVLTRTRIGPFALADALDPLALAAAALPGLLRPALEAVPDLPRRVLSAAEVAAVTQGRALELGRDPGITPLAGEVALVGPDGDLVAIAETLPATGRIVPRRVLTGS
ncbi:MAG TPA: tRNA pseudouridine(55) synthase TruB, partial [Isosphaeraceae bacterium]